MRARHNEGQFDKIEQVQRVRPSSTSGFYCCHDVFRRVKCPYCPTESMQAHALRVHF